MKSAAALVKQIAAAHLFDRLEIQSPAAGVKAGVQATEHGFGQQQAIRMASLPGIILHCGGSRLFHNP